MSDTQYAIADLMDLTRCVCCEAYTSRGLKDPECNHDFRESVIALATENERLRELVKRAFHEGFGAGMDDFRRSSGGVTWYGSKSRKALGETDKEQLEKLLDNGTSNV